MDPKASFWKAIDYLRGHAPRLFASLVTGYFTFYAGYALTNDPVYGITLVLMSEGLALYYPYILESAQDRGTWAGIFQWGAAIFGIAFTWTSIVLTDLASATILAREANVTVFWAFAQIPEWSQRIVVYVLPVSAFVHITLLTVFYVCSPEAEHSRRLRAIRREADADIKSANADAESAKAKAEAAEFRLLAADRASEAGRAEAREKVRRVFGEVTAGPENPLNGGGKN